MKQVFELSSIVGIDSYQGFGWVDRKGSVCGKPNRNVDFFPEFDTEKNEYRVASLSNKWNTPRVSGGVREWNDSPGISCSIPAFSMNAVNALGDLLEPYGELLRLDASIGEYFAYNVTSIIDVLDEDKSEITWGYNDLYASRIIRHEFHSAELQNCPIFRIPQSLNDYYVTEIFVERVRANQLQGFDLSLVWPLCTDTDWWSEKRKRNDKWQREATSYYRKHGRDATGPPLEPWRDI